MMRRDVLLRALEAYRDRHPFEAMVVERFTAFVGAHPLCFKRKLAIGHVTASAWLVDEAGERTLLTHHRKLRRWLQLGGHLEGDRDILAAAIREAREESGLEDLEPVSNEIFDLDIHSIPARSEEPAHEHYDIRFALRAIGDPTFTVSDESRALAWVPLDALQTVTDEVSILRMAAKWAMHRRTNASFVNAAVR